MKILYKPFAILAGILATRLGRSLFKGLWSKIDEEGPPEATTLEANMPKIVGAAVLEAAMMAGVAAAVNRASAKWFHHLTGIWPGDKGGETSEAAGEKSEAA